MRIVLALWVAAFLLASSPVAAADFGKGRADIDVQTNVRFGTTATDSSADEYPRGKNNFRPRRDNDESIVPTLKRAICSGAKCGCGSVEDADENED